MVEAANGVIMTIVRRVAATERFVALTGLLHRGIPMSQILLFMDARSALTGSTGDRGGLTTKGEGSNEHYSLLWEHEESR